MIYPYTVESGYLLSELTINGESRPFRLRIVGQDTLRSVTTAEYYVRTE